jgi:hypothetical protein
MLGLSRVNRKGARSLPDDSQDALFSMMSEPSEGLILLPTPREQDAHNSRSATSTRKGNFQPGETLSDVAYRWAGGAPSRPLTASSAASPAKVPAAPALALASIILKLRSGPSSLESFASYDHGTWRSRTSQLFADSTTEPFGEPWRGTWPRWGMTWRGGAFELAMSALRMDGTGSLRLLGTPTSQSNGNAADPKRANECRQAAKEKHGRIFGTGLEEQMGRLLPTPTNQDAKNSTAPPSQADRNSLALPSLALAVSLSSGASTSPPSADGKPSTDPRPRLSPEFVGWMMGEPRCSACGRGWTDSDCPHSATEYTSTSAGYSAKR